MFQFTETILSLRRVRVVPWNDAIGEYEAFFHVWAGTSERAYAIVEKDDGTVIHLESRDQLKFVVRPVTPGSEE